MQYWMENSTLKNGKNFAYGFLGANVLLDVPSIYYSTNAWQNGQMSGLEYGHEWGKTIAPYVAAGALNGTAGIMSGPAIWTFDWTLKTLNAIYWELDAWGKNLPNRMFNF